jgi:hypothetical protein
MVSCTAGSNPAITVDLNSTGTFADRFWKDQKFLIYRIPERYLLNLKI